MKKTFDQVNEGIMNAIAKLNEPGGMTKANQFNFLWQMSKLASLDNKSKDVVKFKKVLGDYLRERRESVEFSFRAAGRKLHLSQNTIIALETGKASITLYPYAFMMTEAYIVELKSEKEMATV
jgi:hypothetical protein